MKLYAHPFSSYCQKVLIALYENEIPFDYRHLGEEDRQAEKELALLWPFQRFPLLVDGDRVVPETTIIIEYLDQYHRGATRWIPSDRDAAREVRLMDRIFDNDVMNQMQQIVANALRPSDDVRDAYGVEQVRARLDRAYAWLDGVMADRAWAAGEAFTLADCAAAPSLFYADWAHPIDERHGHLKAYRARLLARPAVARAVDEARPFRPYFPLGAPDRD